MSEILLYFCYENQGISIVFNNKLSILPSIYVQHSEIFYLTFPLVVFFVVVFLLWKNIQKNKKQKIYKSIIRVFFDFMLLFFSVFFSVFLLRSRLFFKKNMDLAIGHSNNSWFEIIKFIIMVFWNYYFYFNVVHDYIYHHFFQNLTL